jgi:hypothetical protein
MTAFEQRRQGSLLAPIGGWFMEGIDTADVQKTKALVDKL